MFHGINSITLEKKNVLLFNSYSKTGSKVLSNHYPCHLEYGGHSFHSTEQLFYCLRLSEFPESQEEIMQCPDAKAVKKNGDLLIKRHKINLSAETEVRLLRFCIQLKYIQCPEFKNFLLQHPTERLVEYAPWGDNTYGMVDTDESNKWNWYKGEVAGQNVCGRLIMEVRNSAQEGDIIPTPPAGAKLFGNSVK